MIPELQKEISKLRKSEETCKIISQWFAYECEKLENPYLWDKEHLGRDGRANLKAAVILRKMVTILSKQEIKEKDKTNYR